MGKPSRDKGARFEREIVSLLPGAVKVSYAWKPTHDIEWLNRTGEAKVRKDGFGLIYRWLQDNSFLFIKRDREEPLVVMRVSELVDIIYGKRTP